MAGLEGGLASKPQDLQPLTSLRGPNCGVKIETEIRLIYRDLKIFILMRENISC